MNTRSVTNPIAETRKRARHQRQRKVARDAHDRIADVGGEKVEGPVRQVGDLHHPENEGEAGRQEKEQHAVGNTVETLNDPELHCHLIAGADYRMSMIRPVPSPVRTNSSASYNKKRKSLSSRSKLTNLQFRHWTSDLRHRTILHGELTLEASLSLFLLRLYTLFSSLV